MQQWHYVLFLPLSCDLWLCRRKKKYWMCTVHTLARLYRKHFDLVCTCDSWVNWIKWMLWEEKSRKKNRYNPVNWSQMTYQTQNHCKLVVFGDFSFFFIFIRKMELWYIKNMIYHWRGILFTLPLFSIVFLSFGVYFLQFDS